MLPTPNFLVVPHLTINQAAFNTRVLGNAPAQVPPSALGYNPYSYPSYGAAYGTGYGSASGYGSGYDPSSSGGYGSDPTSGYLRGSADLVNAQARLLTSQGQANLINDQVRQAKVEVRRRIWEEWKYEQANTPTLQDERERIKALEIRRALKDPPLTEIWSAKSLNDILDKLKQDQTRVDRGPTVALDEDVLKQINLTPLKNGGNVGLLKQVQGNASLQWPLPLGSAAYDVERQRLDKLLPGVVSQAVLGPVDSGTLLTLERDVKELKDRLTRRVSELTVDDYVESKRFLNQLTDSLQALKQAGVADYFANRPQGKTVEELIRHMANRGLSFAPATSGEEAAYLALHHALVNYSAGIQRMVRD
jgi:hypothetical protein